MPDRRVSMLLLLVLPTVGCGLGVGPYQPRRDPYATAGGAMPGLAFDETSRRAAHQQAKRETLPEIGGGTTPMYAFDGGYYVGVKQGVAMTREGGSAWSKAAYFFEVHAGFSETLLSDHLTLGVNLFACGYGPDHSGTTTGAGYVPAGTGLTAKLGLSRGLALRVGGDVLYGNARHREAMMSDEAPAFGARATAGLDWVMTRIRGNDLVLTMEAQGVRTDEVMLAGSPTHVDALALAFELVLVGI